MFDAYGWIRVRSSYDALAVNPPSELVDKLDDEISRADNELWDKLEAHLTQYGVESDNVHTFSDGVQVRSIGLSSLKWSFHRQLNNLDGLLTLVTSRNHRCRDFVDLLEWIVAEGPGSYGIIHIYDDEDMDYQHPLQVWRILNGKIEVFPDELLSSIPPCIL